MKKYSDGILYSASDIVKFLECRPLSALDCVNLNTGLRPAEDGASIKLLQDKGFAHESAFLKKIRENRCRITEISDKETLEKRSFLTNEAMKAGAEVIFQATFLKPPWFGYADFLFRCEEPSMLGSFGYEVYDTKLARQVYPNFLVQLGFYNQLLADVQGRLGKKVHVILGDNTTESFCSTEIDGYISMAKELFDTHIQKFKGLISLEETWKNPQLPYPLPIEKCAMCRWREICEEKRLADDHLCQIANIRKTQIAKLEAAGFKTMEKLAQLQKSQSRRVPGMEGTTLNKLVHQAALQQAEKTSGKQSFMLLPPFDELTAPASVEKTGLTLLPKPDAGDLFFDMEGDPLEDKGLEYLFGVAFKNKDETIFKAFWAHSRAEEKQAFENFVDFTLKRLKEFPGAHIYHYASYEVSAMRRLASRHATGEQEIDKLLRDERFIDLFKVVRQSMLISKDSYSIKKVEAFYRGNRAGEVKKADDSIVVYEQWKVSQDPTLLKSIEDYNKEDCISTLQLRDWLIEISPPWIAAKSGAEAPSITNTEELPRPRSQKSLDMEADRKFLEEQLAPFATGKQISEIADSSVFALVSQLLAFHTREKKPVWWSLFDRQDAEIEDLLEDEETIACCEAQHIEKSGKGMSVGFRFPKQVFRIEKEDQVKILLSPLDGGFLNGGEVTNIDKDARTVTIKCGTQFKIRPIEHLIQFSHVDTTSIDNAIARFAQTLINGDLKYKALLDYLNRRPPDIRGVDPGQYLLAGKETSVENVSDIVGRMQETTLYIQGPPGAGKTFTGAHLIERLIKAGKKVAICSNSHKAINHLMEAAHDLLNKSQYPHRAMKKISKPEDRCDRSSINHATKNDEIVRQITNVHLVGGTTWALCASGLDRAFDYLFVDEAGQVSLANFIAMGVCARNIVLLGDQMQLGQPIQAAHPGRSGESALDYLLDDIATIPPQLGLFLDKTFRMHPDLCTFISDCFYEGRLKPDERTAKQRLVLTSTHHPALKPAGVVLYAIDHKDNSQRSPEEASEINKIVTDLLRQRYIDHKGDEKPMTLDDILIVAPYNAQVGVLKETLPPGSRVGTVDKFQGQEAQAVIVSMTSSSAGDSPHGINFLLDRNRLNVAASRGKCLAIIVCSPELLESAAKTVEDVFMLNVLGQAKAGPKYRFWEAPVSLGGI